MEDDKRVYIDDEKNFYMLNAPSNFICECGYLFNRYSKLCSYCSKTSCSNCCKGNDKCIKCDEEFLKSPIFKKIEISNCYCSLCGNTLQIKDRHNHKIIESNKRCRDMLNLKESFEEKIDELKIKVKNLEEENSSLNNKNIDLQKQFRKLDDETSGSKNEAEGWKREYMKTRDQLFPDKMLVFIKAQTGLIIPLEVNSKETVFCLKALLKEKEGISIDAMRLIFAGKQLENNRILLDYDIQKESSVHLIIRLRGD